MKILTKVNDWLYIGSGLLMIGVRYVFAFVLFIAGGGLIIYSLYRFFAEMADKYGVGAFVLHVIICGAMFIGGGVLIAIASAIKDSAKDAKDW